MCGLWGYAARTPGDRPDLEALGAAALAAQRRGAHAWGLAWVDERGRLGSYKSPGPVGDALGLMLDLAAGMPLVVGHARWATDGDPGDNRNNHPHAAGTGLFAHNGTVPEFRRTYRAYGHEPATGCDSECLGLLYRKAPRRLDLAARWAWAIEHAAPGLPLALLALHPPAPRGPYGVLGRLVVARRNGQPLHVAAAPEGSYLCSTADGLADLGDGLDAGPREAPGDTLIRFDLGAPGRPKRLGLRAWPTVQRRRAGGGSVARDPAGRPLRPASRAEGPPDRAMHAHAEPDRPLLRLAGSD
jgi:glucosamine 6-phosphate synthetase-like amidotransferase/phosphosugar isomerase protein